MRCIERAEEEANIKLRRAQEQVDDILENESIVKAAQARAEMLVREAEARGDRMLLDTENQARARLAEAEKLANEQMDEADRYATEMLRRLDEQLQAFATQRPHCARLAGDAPRRGGRRALTRAAHILNDESAARRRAGWKARATVHVVPQRLRSQRPWRV